jgi:hypothetical protein
MLHCNFLNTMGYAFTKCQTRFFQLSKDFTDCEFLNERSLEELDPLKTSRIEANMLIVLQHRGLLFCAILSATIHDSGEPYILLEIYIPGLNLSAVSLSWAISKPRLMHCLPSMQRVASFSSR